jgi:hypothetical protein
VFTSRSKGRGTVDRGVSQIRVDGEWFPIVRGSFYVDGQGGFACTTADTAPGGRAELVGPLWALDGVQRSPRRAGPEPATEPRPARRSAA